MAETFKSMPKTINSYCFNKLKTGLKDDLVSNNGMNVTIEWIKEFQNLTKSFD